jgi:hypothetical protein
VDDLAALLGGMIAATAAMGVVLHQLAARCGGRRLWLAVKSIRYC